MEPDKTDPAAFVSRKSNKSMRFHFKRLFHLLSSCSKHCACGGHIKQQRGEEDQRLRNTRDPCCRSRYREFGSHARTRTGENQVALTSNTFSRPRLRTEPSAAPSIRAELLLIRCLPHSFFITFTFAVQSQQQQPAARSGAKALLLLTCSNRKLPSLEGEKNKMQHDHREKTTQQREASISLACTHTRKIRPDPTAPPRGSG